jgi:Rrf2 family transcriptional regulator, iron-sulfur cluster assembly transcription factor
MSKTHAEYRWFLVVFAGTPLIQLLGCTQSDVEGDMNLLARRRVLAIAAVVDVALHSRSRPVVSKDLVARQGLAPRHLDTLLTGLAQADILKGVRGPRGGYQLAREPRRITVGEIVRTAVSLSAADPYDLSAHSALLEHVIEPAVNEAGKTFLANLDAITVEEMCETAEKSHVLEDERVSRDLAI